MLTLSLLPPWPALPPERRATVERDVVDYVRHQVVRMPLYLRLPFRLVLSAFACSAWFYNGRAFIVLSPSRKRRVVNRWAQSRVIPMRDFIKMVRSCALLAWFDHDVVRGRLETQT